MATSMGCGAGGGEGGQGGTTNTGGSGGAGGAGGASSSSSSSSSSGTGGSSSSSSGSTCNDTGINVGMPSTYATNGLHKVSGQTVLIGRDDGGLYALSALCTHQSCNLNTKGQIMADGIHCNCHGAEFDNLGNPTQGPANSPLKAYALALGCDGSLLVDKNTVVPSAQRLAV